MFLSMQSAPGCHLQVQRPRPEKTPALYDVVPAPYAWCTTMPILRSGTPAARVQQHCAASQNTSACDLEIIPHSQTPNNLRSPGSSVHCNALYRLIHFQIPATSPKPALACFYEYYTLLYRIIIQYIRPIDIRTKICKNVCNHLQSMHDQEVNK